MTSAMTDAQKLMKSCAYCDARAICLRISAGHGLISYLPVCGDHLRGRTPPLALLPEASDLWLSPAEKKLQSYCPGLMREMVRITLLHRQALVDFVAHMDRYREAHP